MRAIKARRAEKAKAAGTPIKPQEPAPTLFPDMLWVWSAFCYLSDRRGVGPHGPVSVTVEAMNAYLELTDRKHFPYNQQIVHFLPLLDREYLRDFYEKQEKEMAKAQKKAQSSNGGARSGLNRR